MKNRILLAALLLASLLCIGFAYQAQTRPQFEFKVISTTSDMPKELEALGREGWDVVAVTIKEEGLYKRSLFYLRRAK